ncbi:hypothetical protein [Acrocarpospora pleiomorpha]|uniref:hypothetical protein n=3 Tax=Acrocarpospora pleiomorpha TaxID=90975 RepID=UPI0031D32587
MPWKRGATVSQKITIDLGAATAQASRIVVAGVVYDLTSDPKPSATVQVNENSGGIAVILNKADKPLTIVPVVSAPGVTPRDLVADCKAASVGETLLMPWTAQPNAITVSLLDALIRRPSGARELTEHAGELCRRIAREPLADGSTPPPGQAELRAHGRLTCSLVEQIQKISKEIDAGKDPGSCSTAPSGGGLRAVRAETRKSAPDGTCAAPTWRVPPAPGTTASPIVLCSDGVTTTAVNNSPSAAFLYEAGKNADHVLGAVPGQVVLVPSLDAIVLAVLSDIAGYALYGVKAAGCGILSIFGISFEPCEHRDDLPSSQIAKLAEFARPGQARIETKAGYYSVAWGQVADDPQTLDISKPRAYSHTLTLVNHAVLPALGLFLNRTLIMDLSTANTEKNQELLDELSRHLSLPKGEQDISDLDLVVRLAGIVLTDPELLARLILVFVPSIVESGIELSARIAKVMGYLSALPVLGNLAKIAEAVNFATKSIQIVLSLIQLLRVDDHPGYVAWPARMDRATAAALPGGACAPPHGNLAPVGAPAQIGCLWPVDANLDTDGKRDRLVLWSTGNALGATAYLADGHIRVWDRSATRLASPSTVVPWQLGGSTSEQIFVGTADWAVLIGPTQDGNVRAARYGNGHNTGRDFVIPRNSMLRDTSCVSNGGRRLLLTTLIHPEGGYGYRTASFVYSFDTYSQTFRLIAYTGGVADALPSFAGDDCAADRVPEMTLPSASAPDSAQSQHNPAEAARAVEMLLDAALDDDLLQGSAFLGGLAPAPDSTTYAYDVWEYLRQAPNSLPALAAATANCAPGVPRTYPAVKCTLTAGPEVWTFLVTSTGDNYVVAAAKRR